VYGDGMQTRTFCYIDDNIDATTAAFYHDKFVNEVVNIGGADEVPIKELAQTIIRITGSKSRIVHLPALEEGDMTRRRPDVTRMNQLLSRPTLPLEEGLKKVLANATYMLQP
jgi:nucleoside-diphosphate-sugar epimerase